MVLGIYSFVGQTLLSVHLGRHFGHIAQIKANGSAYFIHSDELGNVIAISDASGHIVKETCYGPYGDVWTQRGSFDTPWGFGGAYGVYTDPDTELLQMQARYYSPEMKRFISADPTGLKGGVNFYTYADGNPLNSIDPEGLCARPSLFGQTSLFGGVRSTSSPFGFGSPQTHYAQSSFKYAATSEPRQSLGSRLFDAVATLTGARLISDAIYGYSNMGDSSKERMLSTHQRISSGVQGLVQYASSLASIAEVGGAAMVSRGITSSERLQGAVISRVRAAELLRKYNPSMSVKDARSYAESFSGAIRLRTARPGEKWLRYDDKINGKGSFLTKDQLAPNEAVKDLYLPPENTATLWHRVEASKRTLVLEGEINKGTRRQTLILDRGAFKHDTGNPNNW